MIGETVGGYRVMRKLGSGGMGEVWLAEHMLLGKKVAIKFLLPGVTKHDGIVKRFFDEARAASQIDDPGIVVVFDFGWHTGGAYIVMEYLAGETLGSRLKDRRPPLEQALRITLQAALTMSVAHGRGIIHRDLKPDNIFLVPDAAVAGGQRVKILDFGIAKLLVEGGSASNTRTDVVMGTPTYMSPEQCRGTAGVDHRTDIYALGCVLFQLVCGRLPFEQPTTSDMIASHLLEKPPIPSSIDASIPPAVDAILLRCLAKAPADRFDTMTDLARALASAGGIPLEVATIPPVRPSVRPLPDRDAPNESTLSPTTLGNSAAQSIAEPRRGRGAKFVVSSSALLAAALITVIVISRDRRAQVAPQEPSGSSLPVTVDTASPNDASVASPDVAAVHDASAERIDAAVRKPTRGRQPPGIDDLYDNR